MHEMALCEGVLQVTGGEGLENCYQWVRATHQLASIGH